MVQADLKSKERILDTKDEVYLSLNFLVGYDLQRLGAIPRFCQKT
jgi:hypothetical protein